MFVNIPDKSRRWTINRYGERDARLLPERVWGSELVRERAICARGSAAFILRIDEERW